MIEIIRPAGFEDFFRELSDLLASGPPEPGQIPVLAERYGLQFGAGLAARGDLSLRIDGAPG